MSDDMIAAAASDTGESPATTDPTPNPEPTPASPEPAPVDPAAPAQPDPAAPVTHPDWFKADKYKTIEDQAKAYSEAEKRLGEMSAKLKGFQGAPEAYELKVPEGLEGKIEFRADDPLMSQFQEIAKEAGMSQETFGKLTEVFLQYEATLIPDMKAEIAAIGDRGQERVSNIWKWAQANMDEASTETLKAALSPMARPSDVFKAIEAVYSAGARQPAVAGTVDDAPQGMTKDQWQSKWYAKSSQPGRQYVIDEPGNAALANAELERIVGTGDHKTIVG